MVDLAQPTNALVRLQTARTYLQTYISHLNTALSAAKNCTNPLSTLQDAQVSYVLYQSELQAAATVLNPYIAALIDPALATLEQKKSGLTQFGISRTVTGTLDRDVEWERGGGERIHEAYTAVYRTIKRISEEIYCGDWLLGILHFIRVFGGVTLQITPGSFNGSIAYASTEFGGNLIYLYANPASLRSEDQVRGYPLHIAANITHEFGHVLLLRNGGDNSDMYKEWYVSWNGQPSNLGIGQYISTPFSPTEGWGSNATNLQNTMELTGTDLVLHQEDS